MSALSPIEDELTAILAALQLSDNSQRAAAEAQVESKWMSHENVGTFLLFLAQRAAFDENDTIKSFSAVLLRKIAIRPPKEQGSFTDRVIGLVDEPIKANIRSALLQGFASHQTPFVRRKLADAISEVAKEKASPPGSWPDLLPSIFEASRNPDTSFRDAAFRVFSASPEILKNANSNDILELFKAGFEDSVDNVRIGACSAFVEYFKASDKQTWQTLLILLPNLLNSLARFLEAGEDEALASALECLVDLVELAPKVFKDAFPTVIEFCSTVAKNKELSGKARMSALEVLTTFSEVSPAMCKKTPSYAESMVLVTLSMMTEVCVDDDDAAEWNNSDDVEDDDEEEEYQAAKQALDRVSLRLNGNSLAGPLFQYLPTMLQSTNWRERQAALMAISSAAEGCVDVLMPEIGKIVELVLPAIYDSHPRVQYACCNALGQLSTDFANVIQETLGDKILPALISKLTQDSVPRVQSHAAAALVNFCEEAKSSTLEPYLDTLLTNLLGLLQNSPKSYVHEQVLTTIAIIAEAADQKFIKYYDTLMPLLTDCLRGDLGSDKRMLQAKCVQCATLIALAVGKEKFAPLSQDLIQLLLNLQATATEDDDPVKMYLEEGWNRICSIIGTDFLPLLPTVLPPLIQEARATQDVSLLDEEEAEEYYNNEEWDVVPYGGRLIAVHTASLDMKELALESLKAYADKLQGDFYPYVKEIAQDIAIPALDFYMHDRVRSSAALLLASLLKCQVAAVGVKSDETFALWSQIFKKLIDAVENEPILEVCFFIYSSLTVCIEQLGQECFNDSQLKEFADAIAAHMARIFESIKDRENEDDEFTEDVEDDEDESSCEEMLDEISKTITQLTKNTGARFLNVFPSLINVTGTFLNDENTNINMCGLSIIADLLSNCGPGSYQYKDLFLNILGENLVSPHANIRQAATYSVGVAAQQGLPEYQSFCLACLEPMFKMASILDARTDDNVYATANAVSAIAKIFHAYGSSIPNLDNLIQQWIGLLPVFDDDEAATFTYAYLSHLIESNNPAVTAQVSVVVDAVMQALSNDYIVGETAKKLAHATRGLLGSLPVDAARGLLSKYPQKTIETWFS